jgi:hypothetical protein
MTEHGSDHPGILEAESESKNLSRNSACEPVAGVLGDVLKEIHRRAELRQRLEAERGEPISDEEFLRIADAWGIRL